MDDISQWMAIMGAVEYFLNQVNPSVLNQSYFAAFRFANL